MSTTPTNFLPDEMGQTRRPGLVSILGILTFINTGIFILLYGLGLLGTAGLKSVPLEEFEATVQEAMAPYTANMSEEDLAEMDRIIPIIYNSGALLCGLLLLRTILRLVGALGMWKGRKSGFYTYALAQIAGIFLPLLVLPMSFVGFWGPVFALGMTAAYGSQLKRMT